MNIPSDIVSEVCVLGSIIGSGGEIIPELRDMLSVEDFYRPAHQTIARVLYETTTDLDFVIVKARLESAGVYEQIGGLAYLEQLAEVPTWLNWKYYAAIVKEKAVQRGMLGLAEYIRQQVGELEYDVLYEECVTTLHRLGEHRHREGTEMGMAEAAQAVIAKAEQAARDGHAPHTRVGFDAIDRCIGGFRPGDFVVLAAATSGGKTSLACNMAANIARSGGAVLYISGEMLPAELGQRFLQSSSGVWGSRIRDGNLHEHEWTEMQMAAGNMEKWKLAIVGRTMTGGEIAHTARKYARKWRGLDLLVVDYLQIMRSDNPRASRHDQVGSLAWGLKQIAMDLPCPVMALSQFDRSAVKGTKNPPSMFHLKESGDIENHSNIVVLMHTPDGQVGDREVWIRIAKARDGMTNTWAGADAIRLTLQGGITQFHEGANP